MFRFFFDLRNCALAALEDTCKWLDGGGEVAVSFLLLCIYICMCVCLHIALN